MQIRGLDVYDPTTGTVRSSGTDDIACWFIDTDYDEESFFIRHAYFPVKEVKPLRRRGHAGLRRSLSARACNDT